MSDVSFQLTVPAQTENLAQIAEFIDECGTRLNLTEREKYAVQLAVDEAATNIILHAYGPDRSGPITVTCGQSNDDLVVTLHDFGRPFDPGAVPMPDVHAPLEYRLEGGLGLYFMRQLMDDVQFEFDPEAGNTLTMIRHRQIVRSHPSRYASDVMVVEGRGRLDASIASHLEMELKDLLAENHARLIIDLGQVYYIGSSGLRVLLAVLKTARSRGGDVKLCCLAPQVFKVFRLAGFDLIFKV
ncbi:MAG: hypothetical protein A2Z04_03900, partial [Chloroflexi bacterium RBG_16_57_9]